MGTSLVRVESCAARQGRAGGNPPIRLQSHSDWSILPRPRTRPEGPKPVRESKVTVKIPRPLYRKIQQVVDGSGFNSPTDFIVFVLRDVLGEAERAPVADAYSEAELEDVKRKLKNLGYL